MNRPRTILQNVAIAALLAVGGCRLGLDDGAAGARAALSDDNARDALSDDGARDPGVDSDGDGYSPDDGDCDDGDPLIHPGADDTCGDNIDSDCDGIPDKGCRVPVPAGEFQMGAPDTVGGPSQHPIHAVLLDEYYIGKYEVTVAEYRACVTAAACDPPTQVGSFARPHYYDDPTYDDYPVVYVTRTYASAYCAWDGGWLPTEAQWEKAARGDQGEPLYPWGDEWYTCSRGNANWCIGETLRIGSYPDNISPYGAVDMSGNVWELVADYYSSTYYQTSPYENPTGPAKGDHQTLRGGAFTWWGNPTVSVRHPAIELSANLFNIGFRCAYTAPN